MGELQAQILLVFPHIVQELGKSHVSALILVRLLQKFL